MGTKMGRRTLDPKGTKKKQQQRKKPQRKK